MLFPVRQFFYLRTVAGYSGNALNVSSGGLGGVKMMDRKEIAEFIPCKLS
jgi:hypothetical protein